MDPVPYDDRLWYLAGLNHRFGMDPKGFDDYELYKPNRRCLTILHKEHLLNHCFRVESIGLEFLKVRSTVPKMTTMATTLFGGLAQRNFVSLTKLQLEEYLSRRSLEFDEYGNVETEGQVVVRYLHYNIGLGFARLGEKLVVESLYPKGRWIGSKAAPNS